MAARRELALELGADATLDSGDAAEARGAAIKRAAGGADLAVATSGSTAGLRAAIAAARLGGKVVTVGFHQAARPSCGSVRSGTRTGSISCRARARGGRRTVPLPRGTGRG